MALEFDISSNPHTFVDIKIERERAAKDRASFRGKNIRFLIYFLTVLGSYVTCMLVFIIPHLNNPEFGIISYFLPYLTFFIFVFGNRIHIKQIEKPQKIVDKVIASLKETPPEALVDVVGVGDGELPAEVTSFVDKISIQKRLLVQAEIDVIQKWMKGQLNQPVTLKSKVA
ncbi:hypothetical protein MNBD_GAMMA16-1359 [hydrothermal vent metagenome]|uniref:Uncharacterized protein n=1 Tax=hydrothermal vent metagenome TaxID=652676 RepID=A0A3B0Z9D7_9ZZZZ